MVSKDGNTCKNQNSILFNVIMLLGFVASYPIDNTGQPALAVTYPTPLLVNLTAASNATIIPSAPISCNLTDPTYQEYGICWDLSSQQLQISPSLSIDNFVKFYKFNVYNPFVKTPVYTKQVCDLSQPFQSIGILCPSNPQDCVNALTNTMTCDFNGQCICVVGERYRTIADSITPANQPVQPTYPTKLKPNANVRNQIAGDSENNNIPTRKPYVFQRANRPGWSARLTQKIRNLLAERLDSSRLFNWWTE
ncbi:uncharacterized protein LOC130689492 [Daphnia carinata]|uniref:uncharacterized protein LOC130689492 n=1 Tax=Daphnia carinata TaxID=120202 RepID=UPI00257B94A3|nr:uncharacterized protein LOC130689492 [Daphnia carinata]